MSGASSLRQQPQEVLMFEDSATLGKLTAWVCVCTLVHLPSIFFTRGSTSDLLKLIKSRYILFVTFATEVCIAMATFQRNTSEGSR